MSLRTKARNKCKKVLNGQIIINSKSQYYFHLCMRVCQCLFVYLFVCFVFLFLRYILELSGVFSLLLNN